MGRRARRGASARSALWTLHRRQRGRRSSPRRRTARPSCSTWRRSSAAWASGSANPVRQGPLGPPCVPLLRHRSGDGTPIRGGRSERIHPEDRVDDELRRVDPPRRPLYAALPRHPARRQHALDPLAVGSEERPDGVPERAIGIMVDDTEATVGACARRRHAQLSWRSTSAASRSGATTCAPTACTTTTAPTSARHGAAARGLHARRGARDDPSRRPAGGDGRPSSALQADQPTDMEARYRHADGSWRYILTRRVVERDANGEPLAFVGVALDVTERLEQRPQRGAGAPARGRVACRAASASGRRPSTPPRPSGTRRCTRMIDRFPPPRVPRPVATGCTTTSMPTTASASARTMRAYLRDGRPAAEIEFRIVRRDGSVRWMVMRADIDTTSARAAPHARHRDRRDRAARRAAALRDANERVALTRAHAGIGTWECDTTARPSPGTSRCGVCAAWRRGTAAADRDERLAMVHPDDLAARCSTPGRAECASRRPRLRVPRAPARRQMALARVALAADARRARRGCAGSASTGTSPRRKQPSGAPAGGARPAREPAPSRSSSRA